jgi:hypothetical protein
VCCLIKRAFSFFCFLFSYNVNVYYNTKTFVSNKAHQWLKNVSFENEFKLFLKKTRQHFLRTVGKRSNQLSNSITANTIVSRFTRIFSLLIETII